MERLTEKVYGYTQLKDCGNDFCKETCAKHDEERSCDNCPIQKAIEKLSAYEDLEEQGLLLKLPCKVGDYIWDNDFGRLYGYEVTGFSSGDLNEDYCEDEVIAFDQVIIHYTNSNGSITGRFAVSEIGKTVFLTKEQAEAALKEMEGNNGNTEHTED